MSNLNEIEQQTKKYADAHGTLCGLVAELTEKVEALKRQALPALRRAVEATAMQKAKLHELIFLSPPSLFKSPRTQVFHGIKVGLGKRKGGLDWVNEAQVVALIHKHYGKEARQFLHVKESPNKEALGGLPANELKKLAVVVTADSDAVVIKPATGDVEKAVKALLDEAAAEQAGEAA